MNGLPNGVNERICWGCGENQNFIYIKIRNYILWIDSSMYNFQEFLMSIRAMINYNAPWYWGILTTILKDVKVFERKKKGQRPHPLI